MLQLDHHVRIPPGLRIVRRVDLEFTPPFIPRNLDLPKHEETALRVRVHGRLLPNAEEGAEEGAGREGEIVGRGYPEDVEVVLTGGVEATVGSAGRNF